MGIFQYVDSQTGKGYDFTISGENPSDVEFAKIAQILQRDREEDRKAYRDQYGADLYVDDGTALGRGGVRGYQQVKEAVGETIGTIGEQTGLGFLENYGAGVEERAGQQLGLLSLEQPKRLQSSDVNSIGSALTYAGEIVGEQGTQLGLGLGAAALGTLAAPLAAPVLGAAAPFVVGATAAGLATAPILFGNNIQRQEDEVARGTKDRVDVGDALTATFGQAALEGVADKLLLGGFKLLKPVGSTKEGWKGVLTRTGSRATGGAGTESLTEVGQQMLERAQAGLPIDSDDAITEYREAAIAGGLIGGGTRATLGAFGEGRSTVPTSEVTSDNPQEVSAPTPTVIDDEILNDLGVFPRAPFRQKVLGKDIADPEVQALLRKYAKNSIIRNQRPDLEANIEALINGEVATEVKSGIEGAGGGISGSGDGVANVGDESGKRGNTRKSTTPNANALGADLSNADESGGPAGPEFNTLEEAAAQQKDDPVSRFRTLKKGRSIEKGSIYDLYPDATTIRDKKYGKGAGIQPRVSRTIYMPVEEAAKIGGLFQTEEIPVQFTATDDNKAKLVHLESYGTGKNQKKAGDDASETVTFEVQPRVGLIPVEILNDKNNAPGGGRNIHFGNEIVEVDIQDKAEDVDPQAISNTKTPTDPKTLEPIGEPFEAGDEQVVEEVEKPILKSPPRVQGAPKSQEELQAMEDLSNQEAQAKLDVLFEDGRRSAQAQEYHDTEINALSAPEVTTAVDKQGIINLLTTSDVDLKGNNQAEAAKNFFKRFRRPVDALAEIGAAAAIGSNQTNKLDYVKAYNLREDGTPIKTAEELKDEDMTRDFSFYNGVTRPKAMDARRWVHENMSRGAVNEMIDALRLASRNTYKANVIDAPNKNEKGMKKLEDTSVEEIVDDIIVEETVTEATENDITGKPLDQSMAVDSVPGLVNNRMGHTKTESLLVNQGFEKTKVRSNAKLDPAMATRTDTNGNRFVYKDTRNEGEFLSQEDYNIVHDGVVYTKKEMGLFLLDPVHGLDQALLPSIQNALQRGDLQFALNAISATNPVKRVRQIAGKLAETVGTTQVQVVDDISTMVGRKAAGMFRPATNTIFIDANNGMNVHTVLHEMAHAVTSASLANPNLPEVKQLQVLLKAAREQLGDVYGTKNLDEFVAEAFGNPEFQRALALMSVDGGKMAGWKKFASAVMRAFRKALGFKPKPPESPLDDIDRLVMGLLTPAPDTRAVPDMLLLGRTAKGATELLRKHVTTVPLEDKNRYEQARDFVSVNTPRKLKQWVLAVQPVNSLTRLAKDRIPFADELNVLIDQTSGALRKAFEPVDVLYNDYRAYRKANPEGYNRMQALMNRATQDEVDPARPQSTYDKYWLSYYDMVTERTVMKSFVDVKKRNAEIKKLNDDLKQKFGGQDMPRSKAKKAGEPSDEKKAIWKTLNDEYKLLGKQGQYLYNITRDMGEAAQDRIMPAIKARIASLGLDAEAQKTAFEKLSDLLHAQGGVIRPYFKLGRDGDFRLSYNAPDPLRNGGIEVFTEYYTSEKDMMQARENVVKYLRSIGRDDDVGKIEIGKRDAQRNYGKAPSSSFVFEVLQTLQKAGVDQQAIDRIIDLSLDAIPERSFMQSFRSRKERETGGRGILGALGDVTPSGMPGMDVDPAERFRDNFRGIEKQLVQLEYGAKIQAFRNKLQAGDYLTNLDTMDIAKKLDQIAEFAQAPSMARWSQIATSMGFGWTMGANISSAFNIMFDIPMAVHPYLSGEYGGGKATAAISRATKLFMGSPSTKMITVMGADGKPETREVNLGKHNKGFDNYNFDDPNTPEYILRYKTLVEKAGARGMFNQSIDQEHVDLTNRKDILAKFNQVSGFLVHHGERFGRQISLMAAYDLELNKRTDNGKKPATQADYDVAAQKAMEATELTLGSTASAGRPVWAQNPYGNVAFLFKRFAVSRYYFMAHLVDQSLAGADPETRKIARSQLAYFMITTGSLAGVAGLPLMGAVGAIYDMFADDDEDDFEAMMRKMLPGTLYDGLANELLGVDIASRVSMNSLLYRQPFIQKDQSRFWTLIEQLGGPVVGVGLSMERGFDLWQEGEVQRGLEAVAPAAMRNISKFQRFSTEGANTMRGNPIVDDINPYNSFMQLLGFAPADYVENLKINSSERRRQNAVDESRRRLLRRHNMAKAQGDREAVRKIREDIREFNQSLPAEYKEDAIDGKALKKSLSGFLTTSGKMVNGIVYTDAMRKSFEEYE
jgi:hypothetical protein